MKTRSSVLFLVLACSAVAADIPYISEITPTPVPAATLELNTPMGPYAPLVGGVWWTSAPPDHYNREVVTQSTWSWAAAGTAIIGKSYTFTGGVKSASSEASVMTVWNASKKEFITVGSRPEFITEATATIQDGAIVSDATVTTPEGKTLRLLTRIKFTGLNSGEVRVLRLHEHETVLADKADWSKASVFKMERHPS